MKGRGFIVFAIVGILGAGCWSMEPKATNTKVPDEPRSYTPSTSTTPTPEGSQSPAANTKMTDTSQDKLFFRGLSADFARPTDDAGRLLLREYGSVFVARGGATPPKKVVFKDEADVRDFQSSLQHSNEKMGGFSVDLQSPAMTALKSAIEEARSSGLSIGPRAADSSRRGYDETVKLWASRVNPGLVYWVGKGRVTTAEASRIKALSPFEQVPEILKLEQQGIYFATDMSKSIIYSVAPPGTSQHLSMLALDVKEFENPRVRAILAKHGWYQTVVSDLPHFTFLGVSDSELPGLGLKKVTSGDRVFWVPDI